MNSPEGVEAKSSGIGSEVRDITLNPNPPFAEDLESEAKQLVEEVDILRSSGITGDFGSLSRVRTQQDPQPKHWKLVELLTLITL